MECYETLQSENDRVNVTKSKLTLFTSWQASESERWGKEEYYYNDKNNEKQAKETVSYMESEFTSFLQHKQPKSLQVKLFQQ